jgi:hypothetical protein
MKITRRAATLAGLGALATASSRALALDGPITDLVEGAEDFGVASDAYIYGYPLVTMEMTRRVITNAAEVAGTHGPMGQIIKLRSYPDAAFATLPRRTRTRFIRPRFSMSATNPGC